MARRHATLRTALTHARERSAARMTDTPGGRPRLRILVVDDDAAVRDAVCDVLTFQGYLVDSVNGADEAIERFRPGRYQLVITDLVMPLMGGLQLARRLRALEPTVPIMIFSGEVPAPEAFSEMNGVTIARKPDVEALARLVRQALASA
jgi:CheY-like chemotaxis protein